MSNDSTAAQRPNVLILLMDDQRPGTVGALGHPVLKTPTLDALVRDGTAFRHAFTTVPICTPARAELLTGQCGFENGVTWFGQPVSPHSPMLPRLLADAGYETRFVGKWHNDHDPAYHGFEQVGRLFNDGMRYPEHGGHYVWPNVDGRDGMRHETEAFCDSAIEQLRRPADDGRPWFQALALTSPHDPFDAPEPFASMYDPADVPLPPNFLPEHSFDNGDMTIRDELLLDWPRSPEAVRAYQAAYYAMISHHDHHLGRVLDALRETGQGANTLVVFTSDHGLAVGSHGLLGKENMYDHSVGVPLVLFGPGVAAGRTCAEIAHHTDLLPTVCRLAGVETPADCRGHDLLAVARGERLGHDVVVGAFRSPSGPDEGEHRDTQRMIRTRTHKLCFYPHLGRYTLFDLAADPHETHDLLATWRLRPHPRWPAGWPASRTPAEQVLSIADTLRYRLAVRLEHAGDTAAEMIRQTAPAS